MRVLKELGAWLFARDNLVMEAIPLSLLLNFSFSPCRPPVGTSMATIAFLSSANQKSLFSRYVSILVT